ncbi:hypothetical protein ACX93W_21720 [Paenibacillus sp. CAU 1782]
MDYIKWIRSRVGNEMIILNFSGGGAMELDKIPELFNQQHTDAFNDFVAQKVGVFR